MRFIVRVDYYPNGSIVPIGVTNESGESIYIDQIERIDRYISTSGNAEYHFLCRSKTRLFWLVFCDNRWNILNLS